MSCRSPLRADHDGCRRPARLRARAALEQAETRIPMARARPGGGGQQAGHLGRKISRSRNCSPTTPMPAMRPSWRTTPASSPSSRACRTRRATCSSSPRCRFTAMSERMLMRSPSVPFSIGPARVPAAVSCGPRAGPVPAVRTERPGRREPGMSAGPAASTPDTGLERVHQATLVQRDADRVGATYATSARCPLTASRNSPGVASVTRPLLLADPLHDRIGLPGGG